MARDYDREYDTYQGTEKQKKERAMRNKVRRKALRQGRVHKNDGKDIDHKDGDPMNTSQKNTQVTSKHANRSFPRRSDHKEIKEFVERIDILLGR